MAILPPWGKNSHPTFSQYLPNLNYSGSFSFEPVLPRDIETEKVGYRQIKRMGCTPARLDYLKKAADIIAVSLASIVSISVEKGVFPTKLKYVKITPVFKDGDETDPSNYWPISLLSIFNHIFKKIIYDHLKRSINKHNILYEYQYSFRENHSTEYAILYISNKIQKNMDGGKNFPASLLLQKLLFIFLICVRLCSHSSFTVKTVLSPAGAFSILCSGVIRKFPING